MMHAGVRFDCMISNCVLYTYSMLVCCVVNASVQYSFTEPNYTVLENDSYLEVCISPNGNSLMDNVSLMVMSTNNNAEGLCKVVSAGMHDPVDY